MIAVTIGYTKYVLDNDKALQLVNLLEQAEVYEEKYINRETREALGIDKDYTYHVYQKEDTFSMQLLSKAMYQTAKLAGKPEEK